MVWSSVPNVPTQGIMLLSRSFPETVVKVILEALVDLLDVLQPATTAEDLPVGSKTPCFVRHDVSNMIH